MTSLTAGKCFGCAGKDKTKVRQLQNMKLGEKEKERVQMKLGDRWLI